MPVAKRARGWRLAEEPYRAISRRLAGLWLFNEGTGTSAYDASDQKRHGIASGLPIWMPGPNGWVHQHTGQSSVQCFVPADTFHGDYTIAAVVRTQVPSLTQGIVQVADSPLSGTGAIAIFRTPQQWVFREVNDAGTSYAVSAYAEGQGWTSICITRERNTLRGYVNGTPTDAITFAGSRRTMSSELRIGMRLDGTWGDGLEGDCDWVACWSRALTGREVRHLHEQPPWSGGVPAGYIAPSTKAIGPYPQWWCAGGNGLPQSTFYPEGHTDAAEMKFDQHADIKANPDKTVYSWNWISWPLLISPGRACDVTVWLRKSVSFASMPERPIVELVPQLYVDPNIYLGAALVSYSMVDTQGDWQSFVLHLDADASERLVFLRVRARHDTGSLYIAVERPIGS